MDLILIFIFLRFEFITILTLINQLNQCAANIFQQQQKNKIHINDQPIVNSFMLLVYYHFRAFSLPNQNPPNL